VPLNNTNRYVPQPKGPTNPDLDELILELWNTGKFTYSTLAREILMKGYTRLTRSAIGGKLNRAQARGLHVWRPGGPKNIIARRNGTDTTPTTRPYRSQAERKAAKAPRAPRAPKEPKEVKEVKAAIKDEVRKAKPAPLQLHDDPNYAGPFTLTEVASKNTCRYPVGERPDIKFCGRPREGDSSYCPKHHALCHSAKFNYAPDERRFPRSML